MTEEVTDDADRHERIRFRRGEIVDLSALPSSAGVAVSAAPRRKWPRSLRWGAWAGGLVLCLALIVLVGLSYLSHSGLGARHIQSQAQAALEQVFGPDLDISIGAAHFSLRGPGLLNLELGDVDLVQAGARNALLEGGNLRFGLNVLPLLAGQVQVASAEISGARIATGSIAASGAGPGLRPMLDRQGLVDPDLLLAAIFSGADVVGRTASSGGAPDVRVSDVTFRLGPGLPFSTMTIDEALLEQSDSGVKLTGQALFDARPAEFAATLSRTAGSPRIDRFAIDLNSKRQPSDDKSFSFGDVTLSVTGDRSMKDKPARVEARLGAEELLVDLGTRGRLGGRLDMMATLAEASGKIEINRLDAGVGRSVFRMSGAIGPKPAQTARPEPAAYRFELVSNDSELAPSDTGEPQMPMGLRLAGDYRPDLGVLRFDEVAVAGRGGSAKGDGAVTLTASGPPGLALALDVKDMPVSHVKQLWPWFAAEPARRWVNTNLFGGAVPEGGIRFSVPPGRLGNGEKLRADEVSGHFKVVGTRFDTTGLLPPIREADGLVQFAGDDVDITLDRGRVFMSGGQTIEAEKGKLIIRDARERPVIGQLDIGIAGPAAAVAELASLDPINVMHRTGIEPASLSGDVTGTIRAQIPMHRGVDRSRLDWDVKLAYRGLAIAKPIDGQTITDADGTLELDRTRAAIKADARLNGVPAELDIVEPMPSAVDVTRQRDISLALDRRSVQRVAPGLDGIVDGPVRVEVDASDREHPRFEADLTDATLTLPGVGWTKGSGISARASFDLDRQGDSAVLSDFRLTGGTFGISGTATVAGGTLASARFDSFRLNRGDDASLRIDRERGSYSVVVSGDSLDARALIRQATAPPAASSSSRSTPAVFLRADIDRLVGFNDEHLAGVTLSYSSGAGGSRLSLKGSASGGRSVSIENGRADGIVVQSADAGALLRFLDVYERVQGGSITVRLAPRADGSQEGAIDARDFWVVNEPKLSSIVSAAPQGAGRSLDQAARMRIDTSRVRFDRGFARVEKGSDYLRLRDGVLRGPSVGTTFQGTLYDANDRMQITGTFMPAYGLNSIFSEVPVIGALLGNGNEGGLIGVTYRLTGKAKSPQLEINPLSVIAPGIFRAIFEFQ